MKKKIIVVSAIVALVAIALVGSSLAFFRDADEKKNVFVFGSVDIEQHEKDRDGNDFVDNSILMPVIDTTLGTDSESATTRDADGMPTDENFRDKIVTVENVGSEDAYVRTYIAVPKALDDAGIIKRDIKAGTDWTAVSADPVAVITKDGIEYNVYAYYYNAILPDGETTPALLNGVYLDYKTDCKTAVDANGVTQLTHLTYPGATAVVEVPVDDFAIGTPGADPAVNPTEYKSYVLVATEGVQARGFANAAAATNSAFGDFSTMSAADATAHFDGFWN